MKDHLIDEIIETGIKLAKLGEQFAKKYNHPELIPEIHLLRDEFLKTMNLFGEMSDENS